VSDCDDDLCEDCNSVAGQCEVTCNSSQCKVCDGQGYCVSDCDDNLCEDCNTAVGQCEVTCDSDNCMECDGQGNCVVCGGNPDCECVEGECLCCWELEYLDPVTEDNCACAGGDCSGTYVWVQYHNCKRSPSGYTGCKQFDDVPLGFYWECTETPDWCGVLACSLLNATVCGLQCAAAFEACLVCPGSWECTDALMSCYDCLTGEGIDCGCLVVICVYPESPTGEITGSDNRLHGQPCP